MRRRIRAARREEPSDLVLRQARVVNVFSGEVECRDVAVAEGRVVGLGEGYRGLQERDCTREWVVPGFIDGHLHIESSLLRPFHLAAALLPHGTTTLVADPHEIANVLGLEGVRFMLEDSRDLPLDMFFLAPSCVPATGLESAGASLSARDLAQLGAEQRVLGLAEVMNVPAVLAGDREMLEKLLLFKGGILDGHAPGLAGADLQAYLTAGIRSDHECTRRAEALEKLRGGMRILMRRGSTARNLAELLPLVNPATAGRFCIVSDDLHAEDILHSGHLNRAAREAVRMGLDPVTAVQLLTLNPAVHFGLSDRGAVAPGYRADLVVLEDLETFQVSAVFKNGRKVAEQGRTVDFPPRPAAGLPRTARTLQAAALTAERLRVPHPGGRARVIELVPNQLLTRMSLQEVPSEGGFVCPSLEADILKLCVVERHRATGRVGVGLVKGFGLRRGALASSVAHDSHNLIAVGVSDREIQRAVEALIKMGGGLAAVCDGATIAAVPLQLAGLMSLESAETLVQQLTTLGSAARELGCSLDAPFMALSFLALPVIPELKLTDRGLVDVALFDIVPLFVEGEEKEA